MGMKNPAGNIYTSPTLNEQATNDILRKISDSKKISAKFWGSLNSDPVFIICSTEKEFNAFGEYKSEALTRVNPIGSYIVISPEGINENIIAHEITHAELYSRTGFVNNYKIPEWFHEGLAVLSTENEINEEIINSKYNAATLNGKINISLDDFSFNEKYYGFKDKYDIYYITSEMKVMNWLIKYGKSSALKKFEADMNSGKSFEDSFK